MTTTANALPKVARSGFFLILGLFFGCSSKVKYSSNGAVEKAEEVAIEEQASKGEEENVTKAESILPKTLGSNNNELACYQDGNANFKIDLPNKWDRASESVRGDDQGFGVADVRESRVVEMETQNVSGNVLPVVGFSLDDVAFIVSSDTLLSDIIEFSGSNARSIHIPDNAVLLHNSEADGYAGGAIDSLGDTTYLYKDKTIFLPKDESRNLKELGELGLQTIGQSEISLYSLNNLGFVNEDGLLSFKLIHVAHGYGHLKIDLSVPECD